MPRSPKQLDDAITRISKVVEAAKAKTIKRIHKQLERMSPNDLRLLESLLGRR